MDILPAWLNDNKRFTKKAMLKGGQLRIFLVKLYCSMVEKYSFEILFVNVQLRTAVINQN